MAGELEQQSPVRTKAYLVAPDSMSVLWMNESAAEGLMSASAQSDLALADAVPMAGPLGIEAIVRRVAASGTPEHARTDLISMHRGSMGIGVSVYRLPDGNVLVLAEHAWQNAGKSTDSASRPSRRR